MSKFRKDSLEYSLSNMFTLPSKRMVSYQTRINKKDITDDLFVDITELYYKNMFHLAWDKEYSSKDNNELKRKYINKYNIPGRLYNSIKIDLDGKISSRRELLKEEIKVHKERISKLTKTINSLKRKALSKKININDKYKIKFIIHHKHRRLKYVKFKLERAEEKLTNVQRHVHIPKNYFNYVGSGEETSGNQNIQLSLKDNTINEYNLRITVPKCLLHKYGKYKAYDITIIHGYESINNALINNIALTYTFIKDRKGVRVIISLKEPTAQKQSFCTKNVGCIGVDINDGFISLVSVNRHGNLEKGTKPEDISWDCYGKSSGEIKHICYQVANQLIKQAVSENKPIVLEKLDFSNKRKELIDNSKVSKRSKRRLSSFAYNKLIVCIMSTAFRKGIEVRQVNPAYTSLIGAVKYSSGYSIKTKLSIHRSAALVIARRALGFKENLPKFKDSVTLQFPWKHSHVTLKWYSLNEIIKKYRGKHVWSIWGSLLCKLKVEMKNHVDVTKLSRLLKSKDTLPATYAAGKRIQLII